MSIRQTSWRRKAPKQEEESSAKWVRYAQDLQCGVKSKHKCFTQTQTRANGAFWLVCACETRSPHHFETPLESGKMQNDSCRHLLKSLLAKKEKPLHVGSLWVSSIYPLTSSWFMQRHQIRRVSQGPATSCSTPLSPVRAILGGHCQTDRTQALARALGFTADVLFLVWAAKHPCRACCM